VKKLVGIFLLITLNANAQSVIEGFNPVDGSEIGNFFSVDSIVFFTATTDEHGRELWSTDGTTAGTKLVADINPGSNSSNPVYFNNFNGSLFFIANDGLPGIKIWKSNDQNAVFVNIRSADGDMVPIKIIKVSNALYFISYDSNYGIWKAHQTGENSFQVERVDVTAVYNEFADLDSMLFFASSESSTGVELWKTDGTDEGTTLVKDLWDGSDNSGNPRHLISFGNSVFFAANDGIHGCEIWKSNGTSTGTVLVRDISVGAYNSDPQDFVIANNELFFTAFHPTYGRELWVTDGTEDGTRLVKDVKPGAGSALPDYYGNFIATSKSLYFNANNGNGDYDVWKSDGTELGTVKLMNEQLSLWGASISGDAIYGGNEHLLRIDGCGAYRIDTLTNIGTGGRIGIAGRFLVFMAYTNANRLYTYDTQNNPIIPLQKPVLTLQENNQITLNSDVLIGNTWYKDGIRLEGESGNSLVIDGASSGSYTVQTVLANCLSEMSEPIIYTNVNENAEVHSFEIYPNPTSGILYFKNNSSLKSELKIFNVYGNLVYETMYKEKEEINVEDLTSGVYFVKVFYSNQKTYTKKIIKK
jgi:ELWxxDGT repeat protein